MPISQNVDGVLNDELNKFDHIVVLMLENRSFDNLLGYLYQDGVPVNKSFSGLQDKIYSNPVPKRALGYDAHKTISTSRAVDYSQPYPDPGEEYQHINTQLFGEVDSYNIGKLTAKMKAPYNLPTAPLPSPSMDGFINDYESNLEATYNHGANNSTPVPITYDKYRVIMQCFQPDQVNVLSTLAKEFAVFDHWHCSVPSQTWCNRAFWHAGTSGGKVINPIDEDGEKIGEDVVDMATWAKDVWIQPTLFGKMKAAGISYGIYSPFENIVPLTSLIHGEFERTHLFDTFFLDLDLHQLPQYVFLEPQFLFDNNDQHPYSLNHPERGTVMLGEELILKVYDAIKKSDHYRDRTLFIITHDEHGGCYDHEPPPSAIPPVPGMSGQFGFPFNRLGLRVPMVMVSSYIQPNTIINDLHDHTSFIKTACDKWNLQSLTDRDRNAASFVTPLLFSSEKRSGWPEIKIETSLLNNYSNAVNTDDDPLNGLQKSILTGLLYLEKKRGLGNTSRDSIKTNGDMKKFVEKFSQ